jgi:hypothetical protein
LQAHFSFKQPQSVFAYSQTAVLAVQALPTTGWVPGHEFEHVHFAV